MTHPVCAETNVTERGSNANADCRATAAGASGAAAANPAAHTAASRAIAVTIGLVKIHGV